MSSSKSQTGRSQRHIRGQRKLRRCKLGGPQQGESPSYLRRNERSRSRRAYRPCTRKRSRPRERLHRNGTNLHRTKRREDEPGEAKGAPEAAKETPGIAKRAPRAAKSQSKPGATKGAPGAAKRAPRSSRGREGRNRSQERRSRRKLHQREHQEWEPGSRD